MSRQSIAGQQLPGMIANSRSPRSRSVPIETLVGAAITIPQCVAGTTHARSASFHRNDRWNAGLRDVIRARAGRYLTYHLAGRRERNRSLKLVVAGS